MTVLASLLAHPSVVGWVTDPPPSDNDVKAGWTAFAVFLLLVVGTVVLLVSFTRQLRKVNAADEAGLYGSDADESGSGGSTGAEESDTPAPR